MDQRKGWIPGVEGSSGYDMNSVASSGGEFCKESVNTGICLREMPFSPLSTSPEMQLRGCADSGHEQQHSKPFTAAPPGSINRQE